MLGVVGHHFQISKYQLCILYSFISHCCFFYIFGDLDELEILQKPLDRLQTAA